MRKCKRAIAWLAALIFAAALLSPAMIVILESDHCCTGIDCPICAQVAVCLRLFNCVASDSHHTLVLFSCIAVALCIGILIQSKKTNTLIQLKVKLSD